MKNAKQMVNFYFQQGERYMSDSQDALIKIADMHPSHAANAAGRLLADALIWAEDADQEASTSVLWILGTPLFRALQARATGPVRAPATFRCLATGCSFATSSLARAHGHMLNTHHAMAGLSE